MKGSPAKRFKIDHHKEKGVERKQHNQQKDQEEFNRLKAEG